MFIKNLKLRKIATDLIKKNATLRKTARFVLLHWRRFRFTLRTFNIKVDEKTVVFNAFNGKSYSCTPKAVYEYMLTHEDYQDYTFIWAFKNPDEYEYLLENPRTELVKINSKDYQRAIAGAKYWIFNYRVLDHLYPRKNQVYVQCWHGTPLKKLGYDLKNSSNAMNSTAEIYRKYKIDAAKFKYILSPSAFASEKFTSAWNLKEFGKEDTVLEVGYPRDDYLSNYSQSDIAEIKERIGLGDVDKRVILYAPTWRDNQHTSAVGYTYKVEADFDYLRERLGDDYVILFRAHYLIKNSFDFTKYEGFVYDATDFDDINELYVVSDLLITDYSSVFFDYANLCRPILFFMYDFEQYRDDLRGFYISLDELPGPIVRTEKDLCDKIDELPAEFEMDDTYQKFNKKFNYLNDGKATERFVKVVFNA